jgi:hypothetical protein
MSCKPASLAVYNLTNSKQFFKDMVACEKINSPKTKKKKYVYVYGDMKLSAQHLEYLVCQSFFVT